MPGNRKEHLKHLIEALNSAKRKEATAALQKELAKMRQTVKSWQKARAGLTLELNPTLINSSAFFTQIRTQTYTIHNQYTAAEKDYAKAVAAITQTVDEWELPQSDENKLIADLKKEHQALLNELGEYKKIHDSVKSAVAIINELRTTNNQYHTYHCEGLICNAHDEKTVNDLAQPAAPQIEQASAVHGRTSKENKGTLVRGNVYVYDSYHDHDEAVKKHLPGRFVIDHHSIASKAMPNYSQKEHTFITPPPCKVTLVKAPQRQKIDNSTGAPIENQFAPADPKACVEFYCRMAMALLVANGGTKPTKENPIRLTGKDKDAVRYLWTAFMVIGKEMGFGKNEISVETAAFNPEEELGTIRTYAKASLHTTEFAPRQSLIQSIIKDIVQQNKELHQMIPKVAEDAQKFKGRLNSIMAAQQESEHNENSASTPRSR